MWGRNTEKNTRRVRRASSGSNTSITSNQSRPGGLSATIPYTARLPAAEMQEPLWVNQHGEPPQREVVGTKVLLRQQPAAPPETPKILVLTDQMMDHFQRPDRYIKCLAMTGYAMDTYTVDIELGLIDLNYEYIVIFLGTMQLGVFEARKNAAEVFKLVKAINTVNPNSMITFTGLVPRPMDFPRSRCRSENFNRSLELATDDIRRKHGWNCNAMDVYLLYINEKEQIKDSKKNFIDDLYLSEAGIRILRAAWLRKFGFFPKKVQK